MKIISLENVHYRVSLDSGLLSILTGCQLSVYQGQRIAIVGRSGSGKSTLLSLMAGLDTPTEGEVHLLGQPLHLLNEDQRAHVRAQQVGFVFQNFQLISQLTALENVMMPLELFDEVNAKERAMDALIEVGLTNRYHHFPKTLSGGEQQRVALARALVMQPKVIFADEPTGNLDEDTAHHIQHLLLSLPKDTALVVVTHDVQFARACQRHYVMQNGQLVDAP